MIIGIDARPLISEKPTGIGVYVINLLEEFSRIDTTNEYILYSHKKLNYPIKLGYNFKIRIVSSKIGTFWLLKKLPKCLVEDQVDVFWGTAHILPPRIKNVKYCLTVHDLALIINYKWGKWYNSIIQNVLLKKSVRNADMLLTVSESTKNDLYKYYGINTENCIVTYSGNPIDGINVSDSVYGQIKQKYSLDKYILILGTIEPRKNVLNQIKGFEKLLEQYPEVEMVIAGGVGWNSKDVIAYIDKSVNKDRIKVLGYVSVEEKIALIKKSLFLSFVSHYEGFGSPVVEAMSQGAVVVTTNKSSLPEVAGAYNIFVNNEDDSFEIMKAYEIVLKMNENRYKEIKEFNVEYSRRFSWESCGKRTFDAFLKL